MTEAETELVVGELAALADVPGLGVEAGSRGAAQALGAAVGVLAQDPADADRRPARGLAGAPCFAFDLAEEIPDRFLAGGGLEFVPGG